MLFVATCPDLDDEMHQRIVRHQATRQAAGWQTVEEPLHLAKTLAEHNDAAVVLVDCLTLWVSNLMFDAEQRGLVIDENEIAWRASELIETSLRRRGEVIFVTNEVGLGIVPDNAMARRFRDLAGRCNQVVAGGADTVTLMVSGLPLKLKG